MSRRFELTNYFDPESFINDAVHDMFDPKLIYSIDTAHELTGEVVSKFDKSKRHACVIELKSIDVADKQPRNNVLLSQEWRVSVVTPTELYNSVAGVMIVEVIRRIIAINGDNDCGLDFQLMKDSHQYDEPAWGYDLMRLQATFNLNCIIR